MTLKVACHTLSKAVLKGISHKGCEVEDLHFDASYSSEPSLFVDDYLQLVGFKPVQDGFQYGFA